jgi:hypothetical protein
MWRERDNHVDSPVVGYQDIDPDVHVHVRREVQHDDNTIDNRSAVCALSSLLKPV